MNQAGRLRAAKSATAFRTIGEVGQELELPAHVLRFWETKFPELKPLKRGRGRRYYRPEDVDLLRRIRRHLYQEGYTIRGVQQLFRGEASRALKSSTAAKPGPVDPPGEAAAASELIQTQFGRALLELRSELLEIQALLDKLLKR